MARINVTPTVTSTAGATVTPTEFIVDGIAIPNNGRRIARITNGSASPVNVTERIPATVDGVAVVGGGKVVPVAAGAVAYFGPWPAAYNQEDGSVWIDVSAFADVDYEVIEIPAR